MNLMLSTLKGKELVLPNNTFCINLLVMTYLGTGAEARWASMTLSDNVLDSFSSRFFSDCKGEDSSDEKY